MSRFRNSSGYARLFILIAIVVGICSQSVIASVLTVAFLSICVTLVGLAALRPVHAGDRHGTRIHSTGNTASVIN